MNDLLIWPLFSQFTLDLDKVGVCPNNGRRNISFLQLHTFDNMCVILAHDFLLLPWTIYNLVHRRGWGWSGYSTRVSKKVTIWTAINSSSNSSIQWRLPFNTSTAQTFTNWAEKTCNKKEINQKKIAHENWSTVLDTSMEDQTHGV